MADKIDQLKINSTSYDIDLPPDAAPSIASLTASGAVTGGSIVKSGGTSAQFLKADGSVDSNTYLTSADNQKIKVGSTTFGANAEINLVGGNNITITPATTGDGAPKITITAAGGGTSTDVQINGTSIVSSGIANIITNSAYNSSSNKIATMSDLPTVPTGFNITVTDDILDGTGGTNSVKYAPYSSAGAGHLYTGTSNPSNSTRLNYDGYFYATKLYSGGAEVKTTDNNYYPTAFAWTNGTTAGPTGSLTGTGMSAVSFDAIPSASASRSGVVTTDSQTFAGNKTFSAAISITDSSMPVGYLMPSSTPLSVVDGLAINKNGFSITGKNNSSHTNITYNLPPYSGTGTKNYTIATTDDIPEIIDLR